MKTKKLSELLSSIESFETIHGMGLLFDKQSKYFGWSGFVTAALLDFEENNGKPITILGLNTGHLNGWITVKLTREELVDALNNCIEFVGPTEEDCFTLEK